MAESNEKLDDFSKIVLATSSIAYMASQINRVILSTPNPPDAATEYNLEEGRDLLTFSLQRLIPIMNALATHLNDAGIARHIDERATSPAFEVCVYGFDETETDYSEDDNSNNPG